MLKNIWAIASLMMIQGTPRNRIIQSLPQGDWTDLSAELTSVKVQRGLILYEAGASVETLYFPELAVVSFLGTTGNGGTVEVWAVGSEGLAGVSALFASQSPFRAVLQVEGLAYRPSRSALVRYLNLGRVLHGSVLRYYQYLLVQASQLGLWRIAHAVEECLSRWLLMLEDRSGGSGLSLSLESIADAIRTPGAMISLAAAALQDAKVVSYTPGLIRIRSRRRLQPTTCYCYRFIKSHSNAA